MPALRRMTLGDRLWDRIVWLMLLGVLTALWPSAAQAQTSVDGAIQGLVRDSSGAVLHGAVVRVVDTATGAQLAATLNQAGEFTVSRAVAGVYRITVTAPGFAPQELQAVVEVGGVTRLNVSLLIAGASTVVNVDAEETPEEAAALSSSITPEEIERLPVNGREWQTFALLQPGVNASDEGESLLSLHGMAVTQNSTSIDGASGDQSFGAVPQGASADGAAQTTLAGSTIAGGYARHAGAAYTFSQEAVREFRILGQNYSALYGHAAGGVITTVSKSGGSRLHGSGFYLVRTAALGATNPFSIETNYVNGLVTSSLVKPHDLRQQFGGSLGGPAQKKKLFYFYTFDRLLRDFPAVSSPAYAGFYSLTATQSALLANRGVTTSKVNAALNYVDSLTGQVPRRMDQSVNFAKLDWAASKRSHVSLEYNRARSSAPAGARSAAVLNRGTASLGNSFTKVDALLGRWMWTRSSHLSNELRAHYGRDFQYETAQSPLPQEPAIGPGGLAPEIAIDPQGLVFGTPASLSRRAYPNEQRVQITDLTTWLRGPHLLQIGADVSRVHDLIDSLPNTEGTFIYDSGATGGRAGGLVDWITDYTFNVNAYPNGGCPSIAASPHYFCFRSYSQSFGESATTFDTQEWAAFVQDKWQLSPRLTLNAGVRYEYELLPLPQRPNAALDAAFGAQAATSIFPEDRNNFGPRVALAWQPRGARNDVVRVGYGLYFGRLPGATVWSALTDTALPSSATHVRITPTTVTNCPQVTSQGFGYACSYLTTPPAAVAVTTSAMAFDRRFRLPMVQHGSVGVQHELRSGLTASATYLMNLARQLPNSVDINIAPSTVDATFQLVGGTGAVGVQDGETFVVPLYTQRVDASFGPVTKIVSNVDASYNALALEAQQRSRKGLGFRLSWTWSKSLDFGQNGGAVPRTNAQFDPFNIRYDKGLSAQNFPHRVVGSAVWEPRLAMKLRWLREAANGWLVAPLFSETSGRPYSYEIYGGTLLSGGHESINGSGGAVYLPTVGRDTLRLPDTWNVDLRVTRTVRVTERIRVRGQLEMFNVANHTNVSAVQTRAFLPGTATNGVTPLVFQSAAAVTAEGLNTQPFGTFTGASTGSAQERQVQVGLRVEF